MIYSLRRLTQRGIAATNWKPSAISGQPSAVSGQPSAISHTRRSDLCTPKGSTQVTRVDYPFRPRREGFPRGVSQGSAPSPPQHSQGKRHVDRGGEGAGNVWAAWRT